MFGFLKGVFGQPVIASDEGSYNPFLKGKKKAKSSLGAFGQPVIASDEGSYNPFLKGKKKAKSSLGTYGRFGPRRRPVKAAAKGVAWAKPKAWVTTRPVCPPGCVPAPPPEASAGFGRYQRPGNIAGIQANWNW